MRWKTAAITSALLVTGAVGGHAQQEGTGPPAPERSGVGKHQVALDIGPLEGGLSYARRIGESRFALGGRLWAAWEPWNTFEVNVLEPIGGELLVRYQPDRAVQLEVGPTLLRYLWADDCSACSGTFIGAYASAMVGTGVFSLGPTARFGTLRGAPAGTETGILWGFQLRLRFAGGD